MSSTNGSSISELAFFTNYILRNVVPCTTIGNIHDGSGGVRSWAEKNGFKPTFDFSTHQLSKICLSSLAPTEAVVAHNPFQHTHLEGMGEVLEFLDVASRCIIAAVPTKEHHQVNPLVVATVKQWRENLGKLGTCVEVRHCDDYSLFLVLK